MYQSHGGKWWAQLSTKYRDNGKKVSVMIDSMHKSVNECGIITVFIFVLSMNEVDYENKNRRSAIFLRRLSRNG